jgi:hypothetical protein
MTPTVTILTYCAHPALAYGTLLVFKTLRTGFPTATVEVFDNSSHPEVREQIRQACAEVGAEFTAMTPRHYADHLEWLLLERDHGAEPLVLVDPDVIFWESVEGWKFGDAIAAGRLIPDQIEGHITSLARLHPSMFWVPDVHRLRQRVAAHAPGFPSGAVGPSSFIPKGGRSMLYDTLAPLYEAFRAECLAFGPEHLDCYDHIFHGSHLPINAGCGYDGFDAITEPHTAAASGDLQALRGIWRAQERYFARDHELVRLAADHSRYAVDSLKSLGDVQGLEYEDGALADAIQRLGIKMVLQRRKPRRR